MAGKILRITPINVLANCDGWCLQSRIKNALCDNDIARNLLLAHIKKLNLLIRLLILVNIYVKCVYCTPVISYRNFELYTSNRAEPKIKRSPISPDDSHGHTSMGGELGAAMLDLKRSLRRALPDHPSTTNARIKRYTFFGDPWPRTNLTWSLIMRQYGIGLSSESVREELAKALALWAKHSTLTFKELIDDTNADIRIEFLAGAHGDEWPFNGTGDVLAHAFRPGSDIGGDVHFDADENWTLNIHDALQGKGISLFSVAVHEFGHSLGINDTSDENALMHSLYRVPSSPNYDLPDDDRQAIQAIYGPGPGDEPPQILDKCNTTYDAVTVFRRETFIFKGRHYWKFDENDRMYADSPARTTAYWNISENFTRIDAAYDTPDGEIKFFIGRNFYVFNGTNLLPGFPRPLKTLGLPEYLHRIDAAFFRNHDKNTFFFARDKYWRFDEESRNVTLDSPQPMSFWKGVPPNIDAVFQWKDGQTYFFKGKEFWKFNDSEMKVEHEKPMSSAQFWMKCPANPQFSDSIFIFTIVLLTSVSLALAAIFYSCMISYARRKGRMWSYCPFQNGLI